MFSSSNNYNDNLYDEIKSIVNKILDIEAPEEEIEELTRKISLIFKVYTHKLINQSNFSNQNSIFNINQPTFPNTFNFLNPFLIPKFNYSPFNQPMPPPLPFQSNRNSNHQKDEIKKTTKSAKESQLKSPQNPPISDNKPNPPTTALKPLLNQSNIPIKPKIDMKPSTSSDHQNEINNKDDDDIEFCQTNNKIQSQSQSQSFHKKRSDTFSSYIFYILKQVNPDLAISNKAMMVMNSFITDIFERISQEGARLIDVNDQNVLGSREIRTALKLVLPSELAKQATIEGNKALDKFKISDNNPTQHVKILEKYGIDTYRTAPKTVSSPVNLHFSIAHLYRFLSEGGYGERIDRSAPVFIAAVLEYLTAEVLLLSGKIARDNKKERISPRHIILALRNNDELNQLLSHITIAAPGDLPHIHKVLIK